MADQRQFCTFSVAGHYFGLDVLQVQEIIRYQEMTRVPLAHPVVRGLTRRLGCLQTGVETLGSGDLTARVKVTGRAFRVMTVTRNGAPAPVVSVG